MTDLILKWAGIGVCVVVIAACICRLDMLKFKRSKSSWLVMYIVWAVYAMGVMLDLFAGRWVDWYDAAGVLGLLLHVVHTRKRWRHGPPVDTNRGNLEFAETRP